MSTTLITPPPFPLLAIIAQENCKKETEALVSSNPAAQGPPTKAYTKTDKLTQGRVHHGEPH